MLHHAAQSFLRIVFVMAFCIGLHELGHYLACISLGIVPKKFKIGFRPSLGRMRDKYGTKWELGLLPFGGYVELPTINIGRLAQIFVYLAGPIANFVTGFILLTCIVLYDGCSVVKNDSVCYVRIADAMRVSCPESMLRYVSADSSSDTKIRCGVGQACAITARCMADSFCQLKSTVGACVKSPTQALKKFSGPIGISRIVNKAQSVIVVLCVAVQLAFALGFFNLLPLIPFDGAGVLCACLGIDPEGENWFVRLLALVSLLITTCLIVAISIKDLFQLCQ